MWHRQGKATPAVPPLRPWKIDLFLGPERIDMLRPGEGPGTNIGRVGRDRRLDRRAELGVALDEFRHARRQPEHILEYEDLAVASDASADADGRDLDRGGDASRERLGHRLDHHGKGARLRDGASVRLDRLPVAFVAALRAERADRVDRLRRQSDMPPDRNPALDQKR